MTEYVIRGNTAVLKCSIPSFVADFVQVESWISDDGKVFHTPSKADGRAVYGNISQIRSYLVNQHSFNETSLVMV